MTQKIIKDLINREVEAIQNLAIEDSIEKSVELIYNKVHKKGGKVVFSGMGKAGQIGVNIASTLSSTGTPSIFLHPSEAQHGDIGILQENDVLFLISNSGKTREIIELEILAKRLYPKIQCIGLTGNLNAPLADLCEIILHTGDPVEICTLGLAPTTSTTVMTVVGDILVVKLSEKIGLTKEDYAKRHHGGYLGSKARGNE